jgi:hypothetical protein
MVEGLICPIGTWDGQSTARWRVLTAVRSPVGLLGVIGEGEGRVVLMAK